MTEYICHTCHKKYVRKNAYYNHVLICNLAYCGKNDNDDYKSLKNMPNMREMYAILINLYSKYEKLEADYSELKKFVNNTKKKISIIDYLNINFTNLSCDFNDFINGIDIGVNELDIVFQNDYVDGIYQIFINTFERMNSNDICIPIKAFSQKDGILYIYLKIGGWINLDEQNLSNMIKIFDKKLLNLFLQWKVSNESKMDSDKFSEIYILNMKKIIGGNYGNKNKKILIKNKLYKHLRINFKNVVSYEFI